MAKQSQRRVLRNYRNLSPGNFHVLNQKIWKNLAENPRIAEIILASNPTLLSSYLSVSQKHDAVYHEARLGSRLVIAQRGVLQAQTIDYLDEIASILEAAAVRIPDILLSSGFDLAKERRSHARSKAVATPSEDANASDSGQPSS